MAALPTPPFRCAVIRSTAPRNAIADLHRDLAAPEQHWECAG